MSTAVSDQLVEKSFLQALNDAIAFSMRNDSRVIVLGEDIAGGAGQGSPLEGSMGGTFGVTKGLLEVADNRLKHPEMSVKETMLKLFAIFLKAENAANTKYMKEKYTGKLR